MTGEYGESPGQVMRAQAQAHFVATLPCAKAGCGQPLAAHAGWALRHLYSEPSFQPGPQGPQTVRGVDGSRTGA